VSSLYPEIEPSRSGTLDVGDGHVLYWEECGNPSGRPAIVLHGGPGSGCTPWHRRLFDPAVYRVVLFDQRGCGRSTPHAGRDVAALTANTTEHQLSDIEALRTLLGIDRWLVWGGSWGCALALTYAEHHPERVSEMVLWGITNGTREEEDWLFRGGVDVFFPEQWQRLLDGLPERDHGDVVAGYRRLLLDPDPAVHQAAAGAWCLWESATPDWPPREGLAQRYRDPVFALGFARLVTHYIHHHQWLEDGQLLRDIGRLDDIPAALVQGRFDMQGPLRSAWRLQRAWPGSAELVVVDDAGHSPASGGMVVALLAATDRFRGSMADSHA
jgi:proline iminopeptidase